VLAVYGSLEGIPVRGSQWQVPSLRGALGLAASLEQHGDEVRLYRELARLRTDAPLPQRHPEELRWDGTPRQTWRAFCSRWGLARLSERPHRWRDD